MIEIIPAIDIIDGECVRLSQGDYSRRTTYFKDPLEVALRFRDCGLRRLHMVDLDGAKASSPRNLRVLERVAAATGMDVQYGGGIKSTEALNSVFSAGASRAICGSVAATRPELFAEWLAMFGPHRMILGADIKDGLIAINGWKEKASMGIDELIETFRSAGLSQVICTDISKDGMLAGPSAEFYTAITSRFPEVDITVSGGIGELSHIETLNRAGLRSVIVGKAIYEGRISFEQLKSFASC